MIEEGRILLSPNSAAKALDVSRTTVYALMASGALKYVYVRKDRRIPVEEVQRIATEGAAAA